MANESQTYTFACDDIGGLAVTATGVQEINGTVEVPASTTDQLHTIAFDHAKVAGIFMYSDAALTVETNSSGSPVQTFALVANVPLVWVEDMPVADPITTSVTAFYLTNGGASTATLRYRIILNA